MSEYEVVVDDAIEELTDLLNEQFDGDIPKEIRQKLKEVQSASDKLADEADKWEMAADRKDDECEYLRDEIQERDRELAIIGGEYQQKVCSLFGGSLHPDDPDPYGHHGLTQEHRREVILFRESQRLFAE